MENEKEDSLEKVGLSWSKACVDEYGFVYTLGLLRFLSVVIEEEMAADIMKTGLEMESKQ